MESEYRAAKERQSTKCALLKQMLELARRQREMLEKDDEKGLLGLLEQRSRIIEKIEAIDTEQSRIMRAAEAAGMSEDVADTEVRSYLGEIREVITRIQEIDNDSKKRMERKLSEYGGDIKAVRQAMKGLSVYGGMQGLDADGSFFDVRK
ncbi:MAG: flagellar export chaperone FlgN [Christensenellales bacterium]|jgi:flagellar biosynthesis/type III secretory pathway chaperone